MSTSTIRIKKKCEWCGQEFFAQKCSTKYCSHRCAGRAYDDRLRRLHVKTAQEEDAKQEEQKAVAPLEAKEYLSPREVAKLFGLERTTIYRYLWRGDLNCVQSKGKTYIRRSDIESLFEAKKGYQKRAKKERAPITEFYTAAEIVEKYGISRTSLFQMSKDENLPKVLNRGKALWSAKHIDAYFAQKKPDPGITEWYTTEEIRAKFEMSTSAIYNFVSRNGIPSKKEKGKTFYSKTHFDKAKGVSEDFEPEYYTMAEAMKKYNMTRDQIYKYVSYHKVTKYKKGRYTYISRKELDAILAPPVL